LTNIDHKVVLFELQNVHRTYALPTGKTSRNVLQDVSLTLNCGESVSVVGPSGSGKSTLLNLMGGLDDPTSGSIRFLGKNLADLDDRDRARIRNQEMGFVFQLHHLLPQCTVLENVLIPTIPFGIPKDREETVHRAKSLCERVGLSSLTDSFPAQLSGGEQQRVAVVRALINQPRLILADEPTGSLDQETAEDLVQLLLELNREEDTALVVVTHSMHVAGQMEKTCQLKAGRLS
jgi:lipoprotein-releasing system ATP-binding protein